MKSLKVSKGIKILLLIAIVISAIVSALEFFEAKINSMIPEDYKQEQPAPPTPPPDEASGELIEAVYDPVQGIWIIPS